MDDDTRTTRQKAIAEKKRRLEEIKARRNAASAAPSSSSSGAPNNLDDYIDELLKSPAPIAVAVEDKKVEEMENDSSAAMPSNDDAAPVKESAPAVISESHPAAMMMIPQVQVERFEIAIQCEEDDFPPPSLVDEDDDIQDNDDDDESQQDSNNHDNNTDEIQHSFSHASDKQSTEPPPVLTQDALSKLVSTSEFTHFISTASKRVERVLGSSSEEGLFATLSGWAGVDFVNDYQDNDDDNTKKGKRKKTEQHPYQIGGFFNSKSTYQYVDWTENRNITDVEWCPSHPEWVLTSYNQKQSFGSVGNNNNNNGGSNNSNNNNPSTRHLSPHDPSSSFLSTTSLSHSSSIPNEGIVVIYNLIMDTRPEHIFTAGCPIVRTKFHPTEHPKLVLGGGTSGQLLVWDARVGRSPVQRSSVGLGHDVDMVGMDVLTDTNNTTTGTASNTTGNTVGASSNYKLVTASSDGKINYWSMNNMREPVESFTMAVENVNLSCLDVMHGSNNEGVVCGDERGGLHAVYSASASAGAGSSSLKRVVRTLNSGGDVDDNDAAASVLNQDSGATDDNEGVLNNGGIGHYGLVTSVAARPYMNNNSNKSTISSGGTFKGFPQGAGGLVVTTGVDWSTKLWAPAYTDKPLMSFLSNSYDYMCDVQWSPVHPSIFATASSNGTINLWNLAASLEQPISGSDGIQIDSDSGLNRIQWSADGRRMAVASGDKLHVLGVEEELCKSKGDEDTKVMSNLMSRGLIQGDVE